MRARVWTFIKPEQISKMELTPEYDTDVEVLHLLKDVFDRGMYTGRLVYTLKKLIAKDKKDLGES